MPVYIGPKNQTLYWGAGNTQGESNVRLYLGDKLIYVPFRPPEGNLLLAGPGAYLKAGAETFLDYKNTPRVLRDTLSGQNVGTGPWEISFTFTPQAQAGTRYLFEVPGLVTFAYNWNAGYGLLVNLNGLGWRAIPTASINASGEKVTLAKTSANSDIVLRIGTTKYTLMKSWRPWTHAQISAYNTAGTITSYNSNAGTQNSGSLGNTQYPGFGIYYFQNEQDMIAANLSPSPWSYYWQIILNSSQTQESFVKWVLPGQYRISGFSLYYNDARAADGSGAYHGLATFGLYTDSAKQQQIGVLHSTQDRVASDVPIGGGTNAYLFKNTQKLAEPINVNELYFVVKGASTDDCLLYGLWLIPILEYYDAPAYQTGQLTVYDASSFRKLIATN